MVWFPLLPSSSAANPQTLASPVTPALAPPELIPDAVEEILLRVPPDEPAHLLRAALVCKPWRRVLTDPAFLRRYREFHGTPPLLAFIENCSLGAGHTVSRFVPTTAASPFPQPARGSRDSWALDCRHGRVLLHIAGVEENLIVWDPVTGDRRGMRTPCPPLQDYSAAVLCAVGGCDHLDCHGGPFLVVLAWAGGEHHDATCASVYSSGTVEWGAAASIANHLCYGVAPKRGELVGDAICFRRRCGSIAMYDLGDHSLSSIECEDMPVNGAKVVPMAMEDGSLGLAAIAFSGLYLLSRNVDSKGVATWVQRRVIGIETMLPVGNPCSRTDVIGFAEGVGILFVSTDAGTFTVELKSERIRKVSGRAEFYEVIPFMTFYTPGRASSILPLPAETN